jgi:acetyl esterase/lipase
MDRVVVRPNVVFEDSGGRELKLDLYFPQTMTRPPPVVVLIHGGPIEPEASPKDWGVYVSYGELLAASGFAAVTFNHRYHALADLRRAAADVGEVLDFVRRSGGAWSIDSERLALWTFSGGGPFLSSTIYDCPPFVRCLVAYYAILDLQEMPEESPNGVDGETLREFSPLARLESHKGSVPPLLIARAGSDHPFLNASLDRFVERALASNWTLDLLTHPQGRHGFDILDDQPRTREILTRTLDFLKTHLTRD